MRCWIFCNAARSTGRRFALVGGLLLSLMCIGCGGNGLGLVPVVGTVTLDDKPVDGASLLFMPTSSGPAASGITDANGRFAMKTANQSGVKVGTYKVTVNKSQTTTKQVPGASMPLFEVKYELPQRYASFETSGLTVDVTGKASDDDFKFDLKQK